MADQYITHEAILLELEEKLPMKKWNEEQVYRWCQQVETLYVADPDSMVLYRQIPLNVVRNQVYLPENLYKLLDVFEYISESNQKRVRFNRNKNGKVIKQLINYDKDVVWINYIGTPMNDDCMPLIDVDHFPACETLCKINAFEGDALYGEISQAVFMDWKDRYDGMIQGVKGGVKNWTAQDFAEMTVIMGNEIPKIGFMPLANNFTGNGNI